nr:MAG TPA: hypothetical protein [Caudoviricetes sp.]
MAIKSRIIRAMILTNVVIVQLLMLLLGLS